MKVTRLSPSGLRIVLAILLALIILLHALAAFAGQKFLAENSKGVTEAVTQSSSSEKTLQRLSSAEQQLAIQQETVERSRHLVAAGEKHAYQDQIIRDVTRYANVAGVRVLGFTFAEVDAKKAASTKNKADQTATSIPGLQTETVSVALDSPLEYANFLTLLRLLEGNLLQLKPQSINITSYSDSEEGGSPTRVEAPTLTLEVYKK
ncbi:MAG: hypothetical protein ACTJG2_02750 [Candidatus Saccharimonadales bacterium]